MVTSIDLSSLEANVVFDLFEPMASCSEKKKLSLGGPISLNGKAHSPKQGSIKSLLVVQEGIPVINFRIPWSEQ